MPTGLPITRRGWMGGVVALLVGCDRLVVEVEERLDGFASPEGITPITPNAAFYVYQHGNLPAVPRAWTCSVEMEGAPLLALTEETLAALPSIEVEHTLQCIGGNPRNPLIGNAVWEGLPFVDLLAELGVQIDGATEIVLEGADGYHTSIPFADHADGQLWLVWRMNGEPMPREHGSPCRFLVRDRYGTKNVKWPVRVDFIHGTHTGYWESRGWSQEARYRPNGFIFEPYDGSVRRGEVLLFGTAYAGADPIVEVAITYDDGQTWEPAELTYNPGPHRWTLWRAVYQGPAGVVTARLRVTTASGAQTSSPEATQPMSGYDGGMQIQFEVQP